MKENTAKEDIKNVTVIELNYSEQEKFEQEVFSLKEKIKYLEEDVNILKNKKESKLKIVLGVIATVAGIIVSINNIYQITYLKEYEALKLIQDYEMAYFNAVDVLEKEDYYTKNQEISNSNIKKYYEDKKEGRNVEEPTELKEIKAKVKAVFMEDDIVSEELYNKIEEEIFEFDYYKNVENVRYSFNYTYQIDENSDSLNFIHNGYEIKIMNPIIIEIDREAQQPIQKNDVVLDKNTLASRILKINRKWFIFKPRLKDWEIIDSYRYVDKELLMSE